MALFFFLCKDLMRLFLKNRDCWKFWPAFCFSRKLPCSYHGAFMECLKHMSTLVFYFAWRVCFRRDSPYQPQFLFFGLDVCLHNVFQNIRRNWLINSEVEDAFVIAEEVRIACWVCLVSCCSLTKKNICGVLLVSLCYRNMLTEHDCKDTFRSTYSSFRERNKNLSENKSE